nr:hypothetical protein [Tanacetum cinerariifolium]
MFVYVPDESRRTSPLTGIHPESHNRRVGSDTLRKRRTLAKRRRGRHAALQVFLTPKAKPDSASDLLSGGSPHRTIDGGDTDGGLGVGNVGGFGISYLSVYTENYYNTTY